MWSEARLYLAVGGGLALEHTKEKQHKLNKGTATTTEGAVSRFDWTPRHDVIGKAHMTHPDSELPPTARCGSSASNDGLLSSQCGKVFACQSDVLRGRGRYFWL